MPHPLRAQLLQLAHEVLQAIEGKSCEPIEITLRCGGDTVTLVSRPGELNYPAGPEELSPMARALLEAAGTEPATPKVLARKAGYRSLSHVYHALRELVDAGLLVRLPGGAYRRA